MSASRRAVASGLAIALAVASCSSVDPGVSGVRSAGPRLAAPPASASGWTTIVPGWSFGLTADVHGAVVVASLGVVIDLDVTDGHERWRTTVDGASGPIDPAIDPDTVLVSARDRFVALDRASGEVRWVHPVDEETSAVALAPTPEGPIALVSTTEGLVTGVDAGTGAVRWMIRHPGKVAAPAAVDPVHGVAAITWHSVEAPRLRVLDPSTGATRWEATIGVSSSAPVVSDGLVVVGEGDRRWTARIVARDLSTGAERWSAPASASFEPRLLPAASDGEVAVSDHFGTVTLAGLDDGSVRWQVALDEPMLDTRVLLAADSVVLTTYGGEVVALDRRSGRVVRQESPGGYPAAIDLAGGRILTALRLTEPGRVEARPVP